MSRYIIDNRQFIVSKKRYFAEGWKVEQIINGLWLSYQKNLRVFICKDIILIGDAWQIDPNLPSPEEQIKSIINEEYLEKDICEIESHWCGRYVLIVKEMLFLDACGTLGVFYGNGCVSSSLNVLCALNEIKPIYPKIKHRLMPNFLLGRNTPYKEIFRLLPSQKLNIKTWIPQPKQIIPEMPVLSNEERTQLFINCFSASLKNMCLHFPERDFWLALTGGVDSRTALSLLEASKIQYKTFTLQTETISQGDIEVPFELCNRLSKKHLYVETKRCKDYKKRLKDFDAHTTGMVVDYDRSFFANDSYQSLLDSGKDAVVLRSSIWETVILYLSHGNLEMPDIRKLWTGILLSEETEKSLNDYFAFLQSDKINNVEKPNRVFFDLRDGCWLSSNEQSYDIYENLTSVQPCNSRYFLALLFGYDRDLRTKKNHQKLIIQRACEKIQNVPYDSLLVTKKKIVRYAKKSFLKMLLVTWLLKEFGLRKVFKFYSSRARIKRTE